MGMCEARIVACVPPVEWPAGKGLRGTKTLPIFGGVIAKYSSSPCELLYFTW